MSLKIAGVIPARLGSTRLHEKVLKPIHGKPMVEWVWQRAAQAKKLGELVVATDDHRIVKAVEGFGGKAMMTSKDHPNGSSRIAEVASKIQADVFINIQGDEPMMHPQGIDQLADIFEKKNDIRVGTLAVRKTSEEDFANPNVVKVVCDAEGRALYFSRSPLPYFREKPESGITYLKHLGIYGYRKEFILEFVKWPPGILENFEKLEQLRILERGIPIQVIETAHDSWSVDTEEDLVVVEGKMRGF
jgi:3-deoxy-manno-octulosonate cytidylyltransferase (CMP-KDO synthetase)